MDLWWNLIYVGSGNEKAYYITTQRTNPMSKPKKATISYTYVDLCLSNLLTYPRKNPKLSLLIPGNNKLNIDTQAHFFL
jgi:hypothetical protein